MFWGGWVVLYDPFGVCGCRFCKLRKYLAVESPGWDCVVFLCKIFNVPIGGTYSTFSGIARNDFVNIAYQWFLSYLAEHCRGILYSSIFDATRSGRVYPSGVPCN